MSKFNDTLLGKIEEIINLLPPEEDYVKGELKDVMAWVEEKEGTDLEDLVSDFDDWDAMQALTALRPKTYRIIEVDNIQAEAELDELLQTFKQKHLLTEII